LIHSFLWWRGMMAVLASDRFMACIMPLGAVFALAGLNYLFTLIKLKAWIKISLILVILALIIYIPYQSYEIPAKIDGQEQVMKETAAALKDIGYQDKRILFFDPKLPFYLKEDPYDWDRLRFRTSDPQRPEVNQPDSTFLVWDTYFAAIEKKIFLEDILNNKNFRLIDGFYPGKDFNFNKGMNYMSLIFQKVPAKAIQNTWIQFDSLDFESAIKESHQKALSDSISYTGSKSNFLDGRYPFSISANHKLDDIPGPDNIIFRGRVKVFFPETLNLDKVMLVMEVRDPAEKMFRYVVIAASYFKPEPGRWFEMSLLIPFRKDIPEGGYMKLYFWNTGNKKVFIDDMVLEYLPVNR
jgi:hypothetical protein